MEKKKLTRREVLARCLFMVVIVAAVSYFFPRQNTFHYEYEIGKPWRYGRLTAPYDFAIYRSDFAIQQLEDSLHRQLMPRYVVDTTVARLRLADVDRMGEALAPSVYAHLRQQVADIYAHGILTGDDIDSLRHSRHDVALVREGTVARVVSVDSLYSERSAFETLLLDTAYSTLHSHINLRALVEANLTYDIVATEREYARMREEVSTTVGVVLADSRIIDRGEIVTPQTYDILNSFRREQENRLASGSGSGMLLTAGNVVLVCMLLGGILLFLSLYRPWLHLNQNETMMAVGLVSLMVVLTSMATRLSVAGVYLVPIGLTTIVLSTFHGSRTAYFCHVAMVMLCSLIAPSHYEYIIVQTVVGMNIIFALKDGLTDRSQLMRVCVLSLVSYVVTYLVFLLATEGSLAGISWLKLIMMLANSLLLLTSYLIIYALERTFGFMSGVTLVELCNLNSRLLLRLSQDAPGTFQHSLQVGNITADAAKAIGANAQLVRTGALYHDIGKLWNPAYYTENQMGGNPHDALSTEESVEIIKRHVSEGVRIATRANLPSEIVDFIRTHHGRSVIRYFYTTWQNAHAGEEPDMDLFCYDGPDPETREQALLMMGDGVEAASKSLHDYTEESLTRLVATIVDGLVATGRLNNAKITLHDIQVVKESFVHSLLAIYHSRIAYPTPEEHGEGS